MSSSVCHLFNLTAKRVVLRETMHRKKRKKILENQARRIILEGSFNDRKTGETVCRMTRVDVMGKLTGPIEVCDVPDVEKGEVLVDSRGEGSFQRNNEVGN